MPQRGDATKQQLADSIATTIGLNHTWVEGLSKANRNSLIAVNNCCNAMMNNLQEAEAEIAALEEENEALKAEIAELKASITK